jgi:hypothetical protein
VTWRRVAGLALLALMVVHSFLRPEGRWVLASACDLAALATALGLVAGWHRWIATSFLFELAVGVPAMTMGLFTTYQANITGIAVHVVPLVLSGAVVWRDGLPRRTWLVAAIAFAGSMVLSYLIVPTALNLNFANVVWPPLAGSFTLPMFQAALLALVATLLVLTELGVRRLLRPART